MRPELKKYTEFLQQNYSSISGQRKELLIQIADAITIALKKNQLLNLMYVCTHNSRRSQFGQVWAHYAAHYLGIKNIHFFSGGTEITAFHQYAIDTLLRAGHEITEIKKKENPAVTFNFGENIPELKCFSKRFDNAENPSELIFALMTCGEAEHNCPLIPGALARFSINYEDPKKFDGTELQDSKYDERCLQIATESFFLFSNVKQRIFIYE